MLAVVEPFQSGWASPIVFVPKKDRTPPFCIEYRRLNEITILDAYPIPHMGD